MSQNPVDTARTILEKIDQIDEEKPVLDSETYNKDATGKGDEVHTDEGPNNAKKNKKTIDAKPSAAKPERRSLKSFLLAEAKQVVALTRI